MELKRSNFLLIISMGLFLVSFVSFIIWGYQKYYSTGTPAKTSVRDNKTYPDSNRGNLQKVHSDKIDSSAIINAPAEQISLDKTDSTGSVSSSAITKSIENDQELEAARKKIKELNEKIRSIEKLNETTEKEKRKLEESVKNLSKSRSSNPSNNTTETVSADKSVKESGNSHRRNYPAYIGGINLGAAFSKEGEDAKTSESARAEKLTGTIYFKNASNPPGQVTELFLVVFGPDGKLLNSGWETGIFTTQKGKMNYTTKLSFDCNPEETKKINFSIYPDRFQKGNYILYVYLNGKVAGYTYKYLR